MDEKKIDEALHFVARKLNESSNNTKPVLFHSFKVANILLQNNYEEDIVLSGILHDLLEDTNTSKYEIERLYGVKIADIVESVSFKPDIENKLEQAKEMYERTYKQGKEALIVKCADLLDNINYVHLSKDSNTLIKKYDLFISISKDILEKEKIYKLLQERVEDEKRKIK